ncbi:MAG: TadE/TadG family type IV pilus assembly protein [Parvibaculum sp.]|uniref:TadE/TadG family type IV pilus assembly protein n=1 Tax=Parvibaculum sp. TaxID=2024848 RepID=UPI00349FFDD4
MDRTPKLKSGGWRRLRPLRHDQRGSVAIEFSLLAVPFFALLFAMIETCVIYFATSNLDSVVANAGRMVRTGQVQAAGLSAGDFKTMICDQVTLVSDCESGLYIDVRNFSSFGGVSFLPLVDENGNLSGNTQFQPGGAGDIVVVRAYYSWGVMSPGSVGLSNLEGGGRLIASSVAFRNEPFGNMLPSGG